MINQIGDKMFISMMASSYTKHKLNSFIIFIITLAIRGIINSALCYFISTSYHPLDSLIQIIIGVVIVLKTNWIFFQVQKYKTETIFISKYLIENYTEQNFRIWKKYVVLLFSIYHIVYLLAYPIDSYILIEYIVQYLICYFIVDNIENKDGVIVKIIDQTLDKCLNKTKLLNDYVVVENYSVEVENRDVEVENYSVETHKASREPSHPPIVFDEIEYISTEKLRRRNLSSRVLLATDDFEMN